MDFETVQEVISFFRKKLEQSGITIDAIILFGSYARNHQTMYSDIDLAVISEQFAGVHILDRVPMICKAEWATVERFHIPLDVILLTPEEYEQENSIRMSFIRQGIPVFALA